MYRLKHHSEIHEEREPDIFVSFMTFLTHKTNEFVDRVHHMIKVVIKMKTLVFIDHGCLTFYQMAHWERTNFPNYFVLAVVGIWCNYYMCVFGWSLKVKFFEFGFRNLWIIVFRNMFESHKRLYWKLWKDFKYKIWSKIRKRHFEKKKLGKIWLRNGEKKS